MPVTRASLDAGPSRIPVRSSSRRATTHAATREAPVVETPSMGTRLLPSRFRSVSFAPPDRDEMSLSTPSKRAKHRRTPSGESHQSVLLTPPAQNRLTRRPAVRPSLTGGQSALGMTINERAEILSGVAGDCLVTLVQAAFDGSAQRRRRSRPDDEVKKAWDGLYALRQSYIFPPYAPPFPLLTDVLDSIHYHVRAALHPPSLAKAVLLSNLATFVYTILRPDDAGDILELIDSVVDTDEPDSPPVTRSRGSLVARMDGLDLDTVRRARRRNSILLMAWKRFWMVVVPRSKRASESALRLWLDFSTQIMLVYQLRSVHDGNERAHNLPPCPRSLAQDLFSPSALGRYGQWDITDDLETTSEEKSSVEERWRMLAKLRSEELFDLSPETLSEKYPYSVFMQEMVAYIQHEVLTSPVDALLTTDHRRLLVGSSTNALGFHSDDSDEEITSVESDEANLSQNADQEDAEKPSSVSDNDGLAELDRTPSWAEDSVDGSIDLDLAQMMAAELEAELGYPSHIADGEPEGTVEKRSHTAAKSEDEDTEEEDGEEWAIRNHDISTSPRITIGPVASGSTSRAQAFDWTARQDDAEQIAWESQSIMDEPTPAPAPVRQMNSASEQPPSAYADAAAALGAPAAQVSSGSVPPRVAPDLRVSRSSLPAASRNTLAAQVTPAVQEVAASVEDAEVGEEIEDPADALAGLIPSAEQLANPSAPEISTVSAGGGNDLDNEGGFADLLPDAAQLEGDIDEAEPTVALASATGNAAELSPAPTPTVSQHAIASSRPRKSTEAHEFVVPDEDEDMEDRHLLGRRSPARSASPELLATVKPEAILPLTTASLLRRIPVGPMQRLRGAVVPPISDDNDPFMQDKDGKPLEPEAHFVLPYDHKETKSHIHGRKDNSSSSYIRLVGPRKWTKEEELLLYRTVQKVPMVEEYPLRVVWSLYGENGRWGQELKWFNPQHMKDKMRTTVARRLNEGRRVVGRARAWAKRGTRERESFEEEAEEERAAQKAALEAAVAEGSEQGDLEGASEAEADGGSDDAEARQNVPSSGGLEEDAADHDRLDHPDSPVQATQPAPSVQVRFQRAARKIATPYSPVRGDSSDEEDPDSYPAESLKRNNQQALPTQSARKKVGWKAMARKRVRPYSPVETSDEEAATRPSQIARPEPSKKRKQTARKQAQGYAAPESASDGIDEPHNKERPSSPPAPRETRGMKRPIQTARKQARGRTPVGSESEDDTESGREHDPLSTTKQRTPSNGHIVNRPRQTARKQARPYTPVESDGEESAASETDLQEATLEAASGPAKTVEPSRQTARKRARPYSPIEESSSEDSDNGGPQGAADESDDFPAAESLEMAKPQTVPVESTSAEPMAVEDVPVRSEAETAVVQQGDTQTEKALPLKNQPKRRRNNQSTANAEQSTAATPKRGRGRPRKHPVAPKDARINGSQPRRPRGRPRKVRIADPSSTAEGELVPATTQESTVFTPTRSVTINDAELDALNSGDERAVENEEARAETAADEAGDTDRPAFVPDSGEPGLQSSVPDVGATQEGEVPADAEEVKRRQAIRNQVLHGGRRTRVKGEGSAGLKCRWMAQPRVVTGLRPSACATRLASSLASKEPYKVNGATYELDGYSNVPATIMSKLDRNLHLLPSHPISIIRQIIQDHFSSHTPLVPSSAVVSVHQNFDELGFPPDHPGRSLTDSYYLNRDYMLRTHTSAHEVESYKKGLDRWLLAADVYRRDEIDSSHYPVFHQMEGTQVWDQKDLDTLPELNAKLAAELADCPLVIEDETRISATNPYQEGHDPVHAEQIAQHLKHSLNSLIFRLFGKQATKDGQPLRIRWIEAYFPFTTPSYEVEVFWEGEWLELWGCGVVMQKTLDQAGMSHKAGWAFGLGLERLSMVLFSIPDIRLFWSTDPRFASQFKEGEISTFKPYSRYPPCYKDMSFWLPAELQAASPASAIREEHGAGAAGGKGTPPQAQHKAFHENDYCEIVRDVAGDLIESVTLLDDFVHPKTGRQSKCYRLNYRHMDRSLSNEEVNELQDRVQERVVQDMGIEMR
ncbi:phenylalanine-tRNA ligase [Kwoniella sp. DSM 27419]